MERKTRWRLVGAVLAIGAVAAALAAYYTFARGSLDWRERRLVADLRQPDVLIRAARLAEVPKEMVHAPLLRGILGEDLVHYYEDHPTRLSLTGTLKRLAYDHRLSLEDRLIATVLDAPGEVALWRDGQGRPMHFAILLEHNLATRAALELAKVGLPDKQLSVAGEVGSLLKKTTVYALRVDSRNTWLIATQGARTLVLSTPALLLEEGAAVNGDAGEVVTQALSTAAGDASPFARAFALGPARDVPVQLTARTDFLSFGYQHYFPSVGALRTERAADGAWKVSVHTEARAIAPWRVGATALWRQLPRSNALCAALPVDASRAKPLLDAVEVPGAAGLVDAIEPVGAMCWGSGGLFAPMLALQLRPGTGAKHDAVFDQVLTRAVRQPKQGGGDVQPVKTQPVAEGTLWTRTVTHAFGAVRHDGKPADVLGVARTGDTLLASTDVRNLQQAMAVAAKTQPALSDRPMEGAAAVLSINGPQLARLIDAETAKTLQPAWAPVFTRVARQLLPPRLAAVSQLGQVQVGLPLTAVPGSGWQWVDLAVSQAGVPDAPAAAASAPQAPAGKKPR